MPKMYFYKLTHDNGAAPCVVDGLLSLAICKPMIRSAAARGDFIFGFAANTLHPDNRLLFVARITEKVYNGGYYAEKRFATRADRIYTRRAGRFVLRRDAVHHRDGTQLGKDVGEHPYYSRANVLLSADFRYYGSAGTAEYKTQFPLLKYAVEHVTQGHRVVYEGPLWDELFALKQQSWKHSRRMVVGGPTSVAQPAAYREEQSCGVLRTPPRSSSRTPSDPSCR